MIGHPITPYGAGHQKRGFLSLRDSMQCLTLALENPPDPGEYRVFNQFAEVYDVMGLAETVARVAGDLGMDARVSPIEDPPPNSRITTTSPTTGPSTIWGTGPSTAWRPSCGS